MIAALPMYERPQNVAAHDRLWALMRDGLRDHGIAAPDALDREQPYDEVWGRDDLVVGQICNLPWRARFRDRVTVIAAMDYGLPDVAPGCYHSVFVVRGDDPAQTLAQAVAGRFAINDGLSNSGWGAPWQEAVARGLRLRPGVRTGSHLESLRAVAEGRADLCATDAVSWRNFRRWEPLVSGLRVLDRTFDSPGMTLITRAGQDPVPFRVALTQAVAAQSAADRDLTALQGLVTLPAAAYDIALPPDPQAIAA
jgi:ABC-type phosphate/phosphonate transport system substrate-binding protein